MSLETTSQDERKAALAKIADEARAQRLQLFAKNDEVQESISHLEKLEDRNAARQRWGRSLQKAVSNQSAAVAEFLFASDQEVKDAAAACEAATKDVEAALNRLDKIQETLEEITKIVNGVAQVLAIL